MAEDISSTEGQELQNVQVTPSSEPPIGDETEEISSNESTTNTDANTNLGGNPSQEGGDKIETTRSVIAFRFILGFFAVVLLVFVSGWSNILKEGNFKDMLLTIIGTLSSSLGFIIGYYFKSTESKKS